MPSVLEPPKSLDHFRYFILRYHRETGRYEMLEPRSASSFDLGDAFSARDYFSRVGQEYLGGRAMDSALAFGASQAWLADQRAYGLDLCKVDLDAGIIRNEDVDRDRRMLDGFDEDKEFISGALYVEK
jgi:hypothetical protein